MLADLLTLLSAISTGRLRSCGTFNALPHCEEQLRRRLPLHRAIPRTRVSIGRQPLEFGSPALLVACFFLHYLFIPP